MAENVLVEKMGLKPPAWIDAAVDHEYVRYNEDEGRQARRLGAGLISVRCVMCDVWVCDEETRYHKTSHAVS